MTVHGLKKIFCPQRIAVIGASGKSASVGHAVLKNLLDGGFPGEVYPVNPKHRTIWQRPCYPTVAELPERADLAVVCTPAHTVPEVVRQCGEAGIGGVIILSAGFRESGDAGEALERVVRVEAAKFNGLRILGPNCLGLMAPHASLNASFAAAMPSKGRVAFISQSGALCTSVLDWALDQKVGFSYLISIGNMLDVGIGDVIDYLALDPWTDSIILYVESITDARKFMSAARAFARQKPIIAYKAGRFAESAQAAASHTGALAGVDAVYEAAFNRAGIVRVFDMEDLFDCAELLARQKLPRGPRLAIVTNAGGPGVMAVDSLLDRKGVVAALAPDTLSKLNQLLPAAWSHGNPIDVLGDAPPHRFGQAVEIVLADPGVDAMLVVLSPQAKTNPTEAAQSVIEASHHRSKPVLAAWMGGRSVHHGECLLNEAGVPTYSTPEKAVRAFMHLVSYARNRELLYETPRDIPVEFPLVRGRLRDIFDTLLSEGPAVLSECTSKALLDAYEIPTAKPLLARSPTAAVEIARHIGYPVALKVHSNQITHKTEVSGVALNVANDAQVAATFERIVATARQQRPNAIVEGVTVQPMIVSPCGHELIVGAKRDPVFGTVLLVGTGGTSAELFHDCALELPPLNERLARRMLESLRSWPLLCGFRGRPAANIDRLIEVLMRVSYLVADFPAIKELDVNPLLVTPENVIALDARIIIDREALLRPARAYSHLAIRPYPEEYVRRAKLKDGTRVFLRPIKPEDEPQWRELVSSCSLESIRRRFGFLFKDTTHEMATRFCFLDYDREIAIVAQAEEDGASKLLGVGRLCADADHDEAEYAVLVGDAWQGQGLGSLLTDHCLDICGKWGVRRVTAEMAPDNQRVIGLFEHRGFTLDHHVASDVVLARKELGLALDPGASLSSIVPP